MCGRGSRPYEGKQDFIIIDLGANAIELGDWCQPRDWNHIFHHPPKAMDGVAPVKNCPACSAIIPIQTRICPYCLFEIKPKTEEEEMEEIFQEYRLITQSISVPKIIKQGSRISSKPYYSFFKIGEKLSKTDAPFEIKLKRYYELADEWLREQGKKGLNKWHKDLCEVKLKEFSNLQTPKNLR
jgi:predicted nucleic acid-binding Zn ribbon protein